MLRLSEPMDFWNAPALHWGKEPYLGKQIRLHHPDHLGAVAVLHGLEPAPAERCRVLEIGCGDAWNLLPMAEELPGSELTGVDLDAARIERGEAVRATLGLENLTLRAADFTRLDSSLGRFDYVVAHGLYSWAGDAVRDVFFERLSELLSERGVAFVSANVHPGWRLREPARELALFHAHASGAGEAEPLVQRLRTLTRFFAENMSREGPDLAFAAEQYRALSGVNDYLFGFDQLGDSRPSYFEPLVRRAERAGLSYVTDAALLSGQYARLPARLRQGIAELSADRIAREQYADFCALPTFRQFVFSKARPAEAASAEALSKLFLVGGFRQTDASDITKPGPTAFEFGALKFTVTEPLAKGALLELGAIFPHALAFEELERRALARLGKDAAPASFAAALLELALLGPLTVRARPVLAARSAGERPRISEASRFQLATLERATTALHTFCPVPSLFEREALRACDGRRTRAEILAELVRLVNDGSIPKSELGPDPGSELESSVSRRFERTLASALAHMLLLPER
ncbi:MAG TPA: methyltransferase domain-containing protein [Polyangiaceae bacterium]